MPFSGDSAFEFLREYASFGPHPPGTEAHKAVAAWIRHTLESQGWRVETQAWDLPVSRSPSGWAHMQNVLVRIPGRSPGPVTLVGTHWDSRWQADNERNRKLRDQPIPGVNDGGSGTAVQLHLAQVWKTSPPAHDVILAFFDGEDLGDIDDYPFAVGSQYFVQNAGPWQPDRVIALDMVGGMDARYNLDTNSLRGSAEGRRIFTELFALGRRMGLAPFRGESLRTIYSDHGPFLQAGIPAVLLIDIEYAWWHTQADTLDHCSAASLDACGRVLETWLGSGGQGAL